MGEDFGHFFVTMQDGLYKAMLWRSRLFHGHSFAKDLRQPFVGFDKGRPSRDGGDQSVNGVDSNKIALAVSAQDYVGFVIGEERLGQAAAFWDSASRAAFQFQTSNSSSWLFFVRPETMRSRTSVK